MEEVYVEGKGGSSTMPQKRNPITCEALLAIGTIVGQDAALMFAAMRPDHERATGPWHVEWEVIPEACIFAGGALNHTTAMLRDLIVRPERMTRNLKLTDGLIASEAVMMALASPVGRQAAHNIVYHAAMKAVESGLPLAGVLQQDPEVTAHLSPTRLQAVFDPLAYTGLSAEFVDRVPAAVGRASKNERKRSESGAAPGGGDMRGTQREHG